MQLSSRTTQQAHKLPLHSSLHLCCSSEEHFRIKPVAPPLVLAIITQGKHDIFAHQLEVSKDTFLDKTTKDEVHLDRLWTACSVFMRHSYPP